MLLVQPNTYRTVNSNIRRTFRFPYTFGITRNTNTIASARFQSIRKAAWHIRIFKLQTSIPTTSGAKFMFAAPQPQISFNIVSLFILSRGFSVFCDCQIFPSFFSTHTTCEKCFNNVYAHSVLLSCYCSRTHCAMRINFLYSISCSPCCHTCSACAIYVCAEWWCCS